MGKPDGFWIDITVLIFQCYYLFVMFIYLCDTNVTERSYMIWVRAEPSLHHSPLTLHSSPFTNLFIFFLPFVYLYVIIPFDARYGSGDTPCGAPRKGLHLPCTMRCAKYLRKGESKCLRKKRLLSCRSTLLMRATQVLPRFRSLF